jgi:hypothetical protein
VRHKGDIPRSAEALLPPHECGAATALKNI